MIIKGSKVTTKFGTGTVLGFELFGPNGKSLPFSDTPQTEGSRIVVQLDHPENWIMSEPGVHPYFPRKEVQLVENQPCNTSSASESKESPAKSV